MKKQLLLITTFLFVSISLTLAQSNLFIDNSYSVEEMVMDFFDNSGITVSNVTHTGDSTSVAFFDAGGTDLGIDAGIIFCSGDVLDVDTTAENLASSGLSLTGDIDIDIMSAGTGSPSSQDAIAIEFDFTVSETDTLDFNYVFGSEEYPEWVFSQFNDAFAFFISGPGISGPFSNGAENFSTIPGTTEEVAINSVNDSLNSQYYMDYANGQHMIYDGFTTPLPASFIAMKDSTYHVKMVIADRGDSVLDSGVFLSFNSLGQDSLLTPPASFLVSTSANSLQITNQSKYARSYLWDFGNGVISTERNPAPILYDEPGDYMVSLTTQNYCCTDTYSMMVSIDQVQVMSSNVQTDNNPLACFGDTNASFDFQVVGGALPLASVEWTPAITDFNNLSAGAYTVIVEDAFGNTFTDQITISEPSEIELTTNTSPATIGVNNGTATVTPSGGTPPYTYLWSNGGTTQTVDNLLPDDFAVEVTDANGCTMTAMVTIESVTSLLESNDFELNLYPNPVKDQFRLEWSNNDKVEKIEVYNLLGQTIPISFERLVNGLNINLGKNIAEGTYFIRVQLDDGSQASAKFLVK